MPRAGPIIAATAENDRSGRLGRGIVSGTAPTVSTPSDSRPSTATAAAPRSTARSGFGSFGKKWAPRRSRTSSTVESTSVGTWSSSRLLRTLHSWAGIDSPSTSMPVRLSSWLTTMSTATPAR